MAAAGTDAANPGDGRGDCGAEVLPDAGRMTVVSRVAPPVEGVKFVPEVLLGAEVGAEVVDEEDAGLTGASRGVAGALGEGLADCTTHMRCDCVATSFATVCMRVEYGFT